MENKSAMGRLTSKELSKDRARALCFLSYLKDQGAAVVSVPAAGASPGGLTEMQVLRCHPRTQTPVSILTGSPGDLRTRVLTTLIRVAEEELKTRDDGKYEICKILPRMGPGGPTGSLGKQRLLCRGK